MWIVSVSGTTGDAREAARIAAASLGYRLVTGGELSPAITAEFGPIPERAWAPAVQSILCRWAKSSGLVLAFDGCERFFPGSPRRLRISMTARSSGKHDVHLKLESFTPLQAAGIIESAVLGRPAIDAPDSGQTEFAALKQLVGRGIAPKGVARTPHLFSHPSEQFFASLLEFHGIRWQYEPRSFPLQWTKDGEVTEAFTPDFYLPEQELYIELTTMKQALVTRKNRKVRLLKAIYPHIRIQVLYQQDILRLVAGGLFTSSVE